MKIKWLGHSCFLLTADSGNTLITDPYDVEYYGGSLAYAPVEESADVITVSHGHPDHANVEAIGGTPVVLSSLGRREADGFEVNGVAAFHDNQAGAQRGEIIVFNIIVDGVSVCHLGDLGDILTMEQVDAIGDVDVLLIPVGGTFTIDAAAATRVWQQLSPPLTVPMHFRNQKCHFNIEGVDRFLAGKPAVERAGSSEIALAKENLPSSPKIIVLEPAN